MGRYTYRKSYTSKNKTRSKKYGGGLFGFFSNDDEEFKKFYKNIEDNQISEVSKKLKLLEKKGKYDINKEYAGEKIINIIPKSNTSSTMIQILINHNFDINDTNTFGKTILYTALQRGYFKIADFILENKDKFNVDLKKKMGNSWGSYLHAIANNKDIVKNSGVINMDIYKYKDILISKEKQLSMDEYITNKRNRKIVPSPQEIINKKIKEIRDLNKELEDIMKENSRKIPSKSASRSASKSKRDSSIDSIEPNEIDIKCPSKGLKPKTCETKKDYREQTLKFHPDKNIDCKERSTKKFIKLQEICSEFTQN